MQDVVDSNLSHWKDVRAYHVNKRQRLLAKHRQHLISLIPDSAVEMKTPDMLPHETMRASIL